MSPERRRKRVDPWNCKLDDFGSRDEPMQKAIDLARIAARTDLPVLILGETGVGKTWLARAIHNSSRRASGQFVSFNAAALTDTLLDSQLFGHERGAFTGADRRVRGRFELADNGTLFLDEIADMSSAGQAKILRAVEYGEFQRLGSEVAQQADVRLISATHWSMRRFMEEGQFRRDLFYRLSGIAVVMPPLRKRPSDLRRLVGREVALAAEEQGKAITGLEKQAAESLFNYSWPGNLRELTRVIQVAVALTEGETIPAEAILVDTLAEQARVSDDLHGGDGALAGAGAAHDLSMATAERQHIQRVFDMMGGNKRRTARALGISRTTLDRKLAEIEAAVPA